MLLRAAILTLVLAAACRAGEPKRDRHGDPLPGGAIARLGTVQAHPFCKTVAFSADGRTIITTGETTVRHWDIATGRVRRLLSLPRADEERQTISANGKTLVKFVKNRLEVRDVEQNRLLHSVDVPRYTHAGKLPFGPDGESLLLSFKLDESGRRCSCESRAEKSSRYRACGTF